MSSTALATDNDNFFSAFGRAVSQRTIHGDLLKFNKGEWVAGQDEREIEEGTRLVAIMDELTIGWLKWEDRKPVENEMGRVADGFRPVKRSELSSADPSQWPTDKSGKPQDPWQLTNNLPLKEASGDRLYTFSTSSKGGLSAIGQLCEAYGKMLRARPDQLPIVELGASSYKHDDFGRVHTPVLKVVGWTPKAGAMAALAGADQANEEADEEADAEIPF